MFSTILDVTKAKKKSQNVFFHALLMNLSIFPRKRVDKIIRIYVPALQDPVALPSVEKF